MVSSPFEARDPPRIKVISPLAPASHDCEHVCRQRYSAPVAAPAVLAPAGALAEGPGHAVGRSVSEMKFVTFPGLPECGRNAVLSGDPAQGPSIILAKISSGCTVPWHWHSPNEELMMVSGT